MMGTLESLPFQFFQSLADSVMPGPLTQNDTEEGRGEKTPRSLECSSRFGISECSGADIGGPWIGTLILGPGMDEVMCAEELEHQLLLSSKVV